MSRVPASTIPGGFRAQAPERSKIRSNIPRAGNVREGWSSETFSNDTRVLGWDTLERAG